MSFKFQKLLEGTTPYNDKMSEVIPLIKKWSKTGLLDELPHERDVASMAVLLENQAKELIKEVSVTGTTATSEQWSGIALPLVRRVFGELASKEFVSVQPMDRASGLVFFLDFKYGSDRSWKFGYSPTTSDQVGTLHGITNSGSAPSDGLYGAGKFGYTINDVSASVAATTGSVSYADVNFDANLSASVAAGTLRKLLCATSSLSSFDVKGVRAFTPTSQSANALYTVYSAFTKVNGGNIEFIIDTTNLIGGSTQNVWVHYHKQPANDYSRNDFETSRTESRLGIPELELDFRQEPILAKTRKIKTIWSPEFVEDVNSYQTFDAEAELTGMMSEYMTMEIDLEILDMLIVDAQTTDYWSAQINNVINAGQTAFVQQSTAYYPTQNSWFQTLGTKIQKVSNKIHTKTMRGGANWIVCSPDIATIIESIPGYAGDTDGDKMKFSMGVQKVGALNSRFQVYKNPYMQENTLLLGYRGSQFLECGAAYCPYVPFIMTPLVYDPDNLTPRRGGHTRYAKKMLRPEYFGKIFIADLNTI